MLFPKETEQQREKSNCPLLFSLFRKFCFFCALVLSFWVTESRELPGSTREFPSSKWSPRAWREPEESGVCGGQSEGRVRVGQGAARGYWAHVNRLLPLTDGRSASWAGSQAVHGGEVRPAGESRWPVQGGPQWASVHPRADAGGEGPLAPVPAFCGRKGSKTEFVVKWGHTVLESFPVLFLGLLGVSHRHG